MGVEDVLRAVAFEFLAAQFDPVVKNVLLDDNRRIHRIEKLDSRYGEYLGLDAIAEEQVHASVFSEPTSTLYVRCYVDMAKHGASYLSKLAERLSHLKGNTIRQLYVGYSLPSILAAQLLQQRALLLLGGIGVALAYYLGLGHLQGQSCVRR